MNGSTLLKKRLIQFRSNASQLTSQDTMENKPTLTSLLGEYHVRIIWDEKIKCWWLEGTDFTNRQWQSPIFNAADKKEAGLAAINFIQTESAGNTG